jgi:hypothetical protein
MFPLISSTTQQPASFCGSPLTNCQPINPSPIKKNLASSFTESFMSSGKQGGGATVLWEGCDIVTRETCVLLLSLNVNNLGKAAVLHFALFCGWGHPKFSLLIIGNSCAYVKSHSHLIIHSSQCIFFSAVHPSCWLSVHLQIS